MTTGNPEFDILGEFADGYKVETHQEAIERQIGHMLDTLKFICWHDGNHMMGGVSASKALESYSVLSGWPVELLFSIARNIPIGGTIGDGEEDYTAAKAEMKKAHYL